MDTILFIRNYFHGLVIDNVAWEIFALGGYQIFKARDDAGNYVKVTGYACLNQKEAGNAVAHSAEISNAIDTLVVVVVISRLKSWDEGVYVCDADKV
jgi:hypothetical protein